MSRTPNLDIPLQLYVEGGVFSLDGTKAIIEKMQASLSSDKEWDDVVYDTLMFFYI